MIQSDAVIERVLLIPNICNFTFLSATRIIKITRRLFFAQNTIIKPNYFRLLDYFRLKISTVTADILIINWLKWFKNIPGEHF